LLGIGATKWRIRTLRQRMISAPQARRVNCRIDEATAAIEAARTSEDADPAPVGALDALLRPRSRVGPWSAKVRAIRVTVTKR